jgi:hypothetical protein
MSSYYNIFKDTEFIIQNTNSNQTYKLLKQSYQNGGNAMNLIYEGANHNSTLKVSKNETTHASNDKFIKSCKQSKTQHFKQPMIQIGGFYIQL